MRFSTYSCMVCWLQTKGCDWMYSSISNTNLQTSTQLPNLWVKLSFKKDLEQVCITLQTYQVVCRWLFTPVQKVLVCLNTATLNGWTCSRAPSSLTVLPSAGGIHSPQHSIPSVVFGYISNVIFTIFGWKIIIYSFQRFFFYTSISRSIKYKFKCWHVQEKSPWPHHFFVLNMHAKQDSTFQVSLSCLYLKKTFSDNLDLLFNEVFPHWCVYCKGLGMNLSGKWFGIFKSCYSEKVPPL